MLQDRSDHADAMFEHSGQGILVRQAAVASGAQSLHEEKIIITSQKSTKFIICYPSVTFGTPASGYTPVFISFKSAQVRSNVENCLAL